MRVIYTGISFDDYIENVVISFFLSTLSNEIHDILNNLKVGSNGNDCIGIIFAEYVLLLSVMCWPML